MNTAWTHPKHTDGWKRARRRERNREEEAWRRKSVAGANLDHQERQTPQSQPSPPLEDAPREPPSAGGPCWRRRRRMKKSSGQREGSEMKPICSGCSGADTRGVWRLSEEGLWECLWGRTGCTAQGSPDSRRSCCPHAGCPRWTPSGWFWPWSWWWGSCRSAGHGSGWDCPTAEGRTALWQTRDEGRASPDWASAAPLAADATETGTFLLGKINK